MGDSAARHSQSARHRPGERLSGIGSPGVITGSGTRSLRAVSAWAWRREVRRPDLAVPIGSGPDLGKRLVRDGGGSCRAPPRRGNESDRSRDDHDADERPAHVHEIRPSSTRALYLSVLASQELDANPFGAGFFKSPSDAINVRSHHDRAAPGAAALAACGRSGSIARPGFSFTAGKYDYRKLCGYVPRAATVARFPLYPDSCRLAALPKSAGSGTIAAVSDRRQLWTSRVKSVGSTRRTASSFHPRSLRAAALSFFPRRAQRPVVRSLLHRGCLSTPDLFIRRFAGEAFDPIGGGERNRLGRDGKVG